LRSGFFSSGPPFIQNRELSPAALPVGMFTSAAALAGRFESARSITQKPSLDAKTDTPPKLFGEVTAELFVGAVLLCDSCVLICERFVHGQRKFLRFPWPRDWHVR
jgi:hypothetical protein